MSGFVDLHSHFIPGIDDGARTTEEAIELLQALCTAGFDHVVATPHMRPGLFDNSRDELTSAFERIQPIVARATGVPQISLASEHYFDDVVFGRLMKGEGLPYPGGK